MTSTSGIPYAPHRYTVRSRDVVTTVAPTLLAQSDTTRVGLYITGVNIIIPVAAYISFIGNGDSSPKFPMLSTGIREFWFDQYYTMHQNSCYANGFGAGIVLNVTECLYTQLTEEEKADVTRKRETFAAKVKSIVLSRNRRSASRLYQLWQKP